MAGVFSSWFAPWCNHLNENYVEKDVVVPEGISKRAVLKWGVCDWGMSDLDHIPLIKGHIFRPLPSKMRRKSLHANDIWAPCFALIIQWASFVPHAHPCYVWVFFPRYLQERLKQLHEEVSLLKSNIAKYKVPQSRPSL